MDDLEKLAVLLRSVITSRWTGTAEELSAELWARGLSWLPPWYHTPRGLSANLGKAMAGGYLDGWEVSRRKTSGRRLISICPPAAPVP